MNNIMKDRERELEYVKSYSVGSRIGGYTDLSVVSGFLTKGICLRIVTESVYLWRERRVQGFLLCYLVDLTNPNILFNLLFIDFFKVAK